MRHVTEAGRNMGAADRRPGRRARARKAVAAVVAGAALLCVAAPPAVAATGSERPLLFSFDGSDATAGSFGSPNGIEIDQATGTVYVVDEGRNVLDKFNLAGEAQDFTATSSSSLEPGFGFNSLSDVTVDNSGVNPGRIYAMPEFGPLKAFSPAGTQLWELIGLPDVCGLAVDTAGHPWLGDYTNHQAVKYASSGSPPDTAGAISTEPNPTCRLDLDASGNLYANVYGGGVDKYVGGIKTATIDSEYTDAVTVDQSGASGHVFTLHSGSFNEYDSAGDLIRNTGEGVLQSGRGIAYDQAQDRVYVTDGGSGEVKVFGPSISGPVPTGTIEPTSPIGIGKATFNGRVNPEDLPAAYFFQWKQGEESSWSTAHSSAQQTLPADNSDHAVSFNATGLSGNTTYQVRLVTVNTDSHLKSYSGVDTFSTVLPPPPTVTIDPLTPGSGSVDVTGTVNPQGDPNTYWSIQISTDPACGSEFSGQFHELESENSAPVEVFEEITGLAPSQHYCVRIHAGNSGGESNSPVQEIETLAIPPSQAQTAFVAPRGDTSVRLNGRVNPEGSAITYHFEYSADGGSTWTALPNVIDDSHARQQIVVSQELEGLTPGTSYRYRFVVENGAGAASPQGGDASFTTRTSAEFADPTACPNEDVRVAQHSTYLSHCRGVELVNTPDKGNQSVVTNQPYLGTPISSDGETVLWNVVGGAPQGTTGTGATFLAQRTAEGWRSKSLIPPATEQLGHGAFAFAFAAATPDLSKFAVVGGKPSFQSKEAPTLMRVNSDSSYEALASYPNARIQDGTSADLTPDGAHVFAINPETRQLEDVGSGSPELISVMPDGAPSECGMNLEGASFIGPSGAGYGASDSWRPGYSRFSADGSRVYFETQPNDECGAPFGLYERNRDAGTTTLIDPGANGYDSYMVRATPDGRSAIFVTAGALDPADTNSDLDVYRWDEEAGASSCLTCVVADADLDPSEPAVMVSDDFSHVYFESPKQLIPGLGQPDGSNIYSLSEGTIRFVTAARGSLKNNPLYYGIEPIAELSTDGNVLVFKAYPDLSVTSDEVDERCPDAEGGNPGEPCLQLYRYDNRDGSVECVTCVQGGRTATSVANRYGSLAKSDFRLSDDGGTLAFVTGNRLLSRDVNNSTDVYEWHDGKTSLISDGVSDFPASAFGLPAVRGVTAGGRDVFYSIVDPGRTGYEQDGVGNLYDARVDGGFPVPTAPVHCSEESCQGPLQAAPGLRQAGSAELHGAGNRKDKRAKRKRCGTKHGARKKHCARKHGGRKRHPHKSNGTVRGSK